MKAPISERAMLRRINIRLAATGEKLRRPTAAERREDPGLVNYVLADATTNKTAFGGATDVWLPGFAEGFDLLHDDEVLVLDDGKALVRRGTGWLMPAEGVGA